MWAICERIAEVQTLLDDHIAGGKHTAADVIAKAQAILSEPALQRALFDVGYFPPNTPPEHAYNKFEFRFLNQKFSGAGRPSAYVRL
jgi:hypothetical protein